MVVSATDQFYGTVDTIYAAPLSAHGWKKALRSISRLLGAGMTTYSGSFDNSMHYQPAFMRQDVETPDANRQYLEYYHSICERGRFSRYEAVGSVYFDYKYFTETEIDRSEYYNFLARHGGKYALGTTLAKPNQSSVCTGTQQCAVHFSARHGHPEPEKRDLFENLVPHLIRANQLSTQLGQTHAQLVGMRTALDISPVALVGLAVDGRVEFVNHQAEKILLQCQAIAVSKHKVRFRHAATRRRFAELLKDATAKSVTSSLSMPVQRLSGKQPIMLTVTPVELAPELLNGEAFPYIRFLLTITDLGNKQTFDCGHLQTVFGLTSTEARLAASLAEGLSLAEFCEAQCMGIQTGRWHLKNVMAKTSTHKQVELVRLIYQISPKRNE